MTVNKRIKGWVYSIKAVPAGVKNEDINFLSIDL